MNVSTPQQRVAAVVVTYNRLELLKECIAALRSQSRPADEIIIVNNGSTDGTADWLSTQPGLFVIVQDNCGGAGGFETGVRVAYERGHDWIWLMDDDTIPDPDALFHLVAAVALAPTAPFFSSCVRGPSGLPMNTPVIDGRESKNGYPNWYGLLAHGLVAITCATFVSTMVSANAVEKYGLPIGAFFIWGDDSEYTMRIAALGSGYIVGGSTVLHKRGIERPTGIFEEKDPKRIQMYRYYYRNNANLYRQKFGWLGYPRFVLTVLRLHLVRCFGERHGWLRAGVIIRGTVAGLRFRPAVPRVFQTRAVREPHLSDS